MNKGLLVAILIIAIVGAITITVWKSGTQGSAPSRITGQQISKIDMNDPTKTETLTLQQWEDRGTDGQGHYKNAQGEFTMVPPMKCPHCGKEIPSLIKPNTGDEDKDNEAYAEMQQKYVCPFCKKPIIGK